ncbi:MAG: hypothetical protein K0Q79_2328 [Flavipsychrobacter sp.]|jgi:hypothetical protein|nr:hypothetical protein [Flavipsychrobacter sp.]
MKKILVALMMLTMCGFSANAQKRGKKEIPQNFHVCKSDKGYYICDEVPGPGNSTNPGVVIREDIDEGGLNPDKDRMKWLKEGHRVSQRDGTAPESQSYPENIYTIYGIGNPYLEPRYIVLGPFGHVR